MLTARPPTTGPSGHGAPTSTTPKSASGAASWWPTTGPRVGDWCPGLEDHPAHPCADLVADHVIEIAVGGLATGPLRVLCRSENSRRSAHLASGLLLPNQSTTPRQPKFPTLLESTDPGADGGPVVA